MKLSLVVMSGKTGGQVLEIKLAQFVVGRDPQCHLRPASSLISKRHCALLQRDGKVFVRDFDSTNGTFVNDQQVKGEVEVHHDDKLKIGPLLFGVRLEASVTVNRPTPPPPTRAPVTKTLRKDPAGTAAVTVSDPTPLPPTLADSDSGAGAMDSDDDIAAMLLNTQDDGPTTAGLTGGDVPEGSTIHDLPVAADLLAAQEQEKKDLEAKAKTAIGNTSNAAKSILEKYMRRPRTQE